MEEEEQRKQLEQLKHALESSRQLRQATMNFEHAALKPLFLLNGGALIAFIAFLGSDAGRIMNRDLVISALVCWAIGLLFAAVAVLYGYGSQFAFYKAHGHNLCLKFKIYEYEPIERPVLEEKARSDYERESNWGNHRRHKSHVTGVLSLLSFAIGVLFASFAFL